MGHERSSRYFAVGLAAVICLLGVSCSTGTVAHPRYGFELAVAPSADDPHVYETVVTVRDLASGDVVFQPKVVSPEGEPATVEAGDRASGVDFRVTVEIGGDGGSAHYMAELRDASGVVATQDARIRLRPS